MCDAMWMRFGDCLYVNGIVIAIAAQLLVNMHCDLYALSILPLQQQTRFTLCDSFWSVFFLLFSVARCKTDTNTVVYQWFYGLTLPNVFPSTSEHSVREKPDESASFWAIQLRPLYFRAASSKGRLQLSIDNATVGISFIYHHHCTVCWPTADPLAITQQMNERVNALRCIENPLCKIQR